jgi:acylphosphatase
MKGAAINRLDGTVERVAEGTPEAVKKFQSWLMIGPDMATVEKVETVGLESQIEFKDFRIG